MGSFYYFVFRWEAFLFFSWRNSNGGKWHALGYLLIFNFFNKCTTTNSGTAFVDDFDQDQSTDKFQGEIPDWIGESMPSLKFFFPAV